MEKQAPSEMGIIPSESPSYIKLLIVNRELLVTHIRNTQCLLDNLLKNDYFSEEDSEIVCACPTQPDKVRKLLDLAQSKGEEVCEFLLYVLQQLADAYVDLRPWLLEIGFSPSQLIQSRVVVNTDPVSRYTQKLRHHLGRDSKFILCYGQKEELLLEEVYTDTIMELVSFTNESLGPLGSLAGLLDHSTGILNEQGETVLVSGDAGVGKSMLLRRLQGLWASGQLDTGIKFFFHFRCRMFSCFKDSDTLCLQDLLFKHYCYPEQDPEEVFAFLLRFPHTALFTFDGLDELHSDFDLSSVPDTSSPLAPAHPLVLLANLLSGKLLKGATKLLTARTGIEIPRQLLRKKVFLRGFSPSHLQAYTRQMFPDRTLQSRLLDQLEANPNLCSLCAVPLFCWIIFRCFQHFHATFDTTLQLPDCKVTLTDVFLLVTEVHLNRTQPTSLVQHNTRSQAETFRSGQGMLHTLGQVAHQGMEKNLFVFSQEQVQASQMQEGDLQLGFLRAVPELGPEGEQPSYEFFHITLQAFFTAFFLVVDNKVGTQELLRFFQEWAPPGEAAVASCFPRSLPFQCLGGSGLVGEDPFKNKDHFQFTNLFLCGLLSKAKQKLLRHLVPVAALKRKRKALWAHLFASLRSYLKSLPRVQVEGVSQVHGMPTFIWMLRCIYETQSEKVGKLAARGICANYLKLTFCNAYSADCSALSFVLHHFRKRLALSLDNNNLNDYGVQELQPCFSRLTIIRLSVNQITDRGVKVLYEELTKYKIVTFLGLYNNQITDVGAKYVARILEECKSLAYLKLGLNKITSEGGKCLALAVKNSKSICDVGMWGNTVGDEGAKAFAEALRNHPSLTSLSLAFNGISTEGGKSLARALQQNTSLRILWLTKNELNDEVAESLAEMLKINQTLQHLWLIQNQITAKGVAHLADALQENTGITEICLNGNLIKPEEAKVYEDEKRIICL
ncbi:nucleotide-binding oligomerization domain-containing protein 1 isoform X1 [Elephas maximus indicus]|uniref:nucleotide-binding oligomerization domain-containing protein 1 isoform X1 n=1 Tax=Elephas maximus indicus TaxID=99487 RepID=UPI0021160CCC|nr:nucleotide-binding oligomerization domain-containing protein 1 isoform X1 [Elephas maximus indicus]XP_049749190.1 nucleotide-binding oligomerization domain-containing protein 1 isoform X1 [Elephas maximus indicus]XP_049749191.1 nucleotide-binding oligomerization domain-containing protein 1 isoform X1 [Elephas maximus indicus]XP_049749192.1 nucleotide-binding oligomerization domain-containing protein 1 isoform X1 [Elephas maximus indicus]XP_049749193.1 nucleotide-binding oligomerization domai